MKILVLGASGMIGSTIFKVLQSETEWEVFGSIRSDDIRDYFSDKLSNKLIGQVDLEHPDSLPRLFDITKPAIVINCVGLTKHKKGAEDPLVSVPLNSLLPHRLAQICKLVNARLIHISTDCVFSGKHGLYTETDLADAEDIYGKSKALGEVLYPHALTIRTSTIGPELNTQYGLLNWFLSQEIECQGYTKAIFSGLPTVVLAEIIRDFVIGRPDLNGLYHVGAQPIDKYTLLKLISEVYGKSIKIIPNDQFAIDRSLDSSKFELATGYIAPSWSELVKRMHV